MPQIVAPIREKDLKAAMTAFWNTIFKQDKRYGMKIMDAQGNMVCRPINFEDFKNQKELENMLNAMKAGCEAFMKSWL